KYYITKKGWNPNKPLTRSDLDLVPFYVKNDGGARPGTTVTHEANVPTDRSGYHLILAVWEIADTGNAFYQVIDVNLFLLLLQRLLFQVPLGVQERRLYQQRNLKK
ncbi:lytic polysaccharide monooxygenase, partial [Bacillus sp. HC-TM]